MRGLVFEDVNKDGIFTPATDMPVGGVGVSDGATVVLSKPDGTYELRTTADSASIFVTKPANFLPRRDFFQIQDANGLYSPPAPLPGAAPKLPGTSPLSTLTTTALPSAADTSAPAALNTESPEPLALPASAPAAKSYEVNFPLTKASKPDSTTIRFLHAGDIGCSGKTDSAHLAAAVAELNRVLPPPDFVVATGELARLRAGAPAVDTFAAEVARSKVPWFNVYGAPAETAGAALDQNSADSLAALADTVAPEYYSADYGSVHLVMLGGPPIGPTATRRAAWLDQDADALSRGKTLIVCMAFPPSPQDIDQLTRLHAKLVLHGGRWANRIVSPERSGMAIIGQSPLFVGGADASPAGFRMVTVTAEGQITSRMRYSGTEKYLRIIYPQGEMTDLTNMVVNAYDTDRGISEIRYRIEAPQQGPVAEGQLKQTGSLTYTAPLEATALGIKELPAEFTLRVRATDFAGNQWEASSVVSRAASRFHRSQAAAAVKLGEGWPEFMGNAQHTGTAFGQLRPPLTLRWVLPTHGSADVASPVLWKEQLTVAVKDRDNLMNNGLAMLDAATGKVVQFMQTDSMINHSPAYAEDPQDGPGSVYGVTVTGAVNRMKGGDGSALGTGALTGSPAQRWLYAAPTVQSRLAITGGAGGMMALSSMFGERRWMSTFGNDFMPSFASPSLAGDQVICGAQQIRSGGMWAGIYSLSVNSGNTIWSNDCPGISGSVCVGAGRGYAIDSTGKLKVIDLRSGADVAAVQLARGWSISTPACDGDIVVAPSGAGTVEAFDAKSMAPRWKFRSGRSLWKMAPFDSEGRAVFSSPTISGNVVYIGCSDGKLYALDRSSGQAVWSYDFGIPTLSSPCVSGNALFTAALDGNIYCFTGEYNAPPPPTKEEKKAAEQKKTRGGPETTEYR